MLNIEKHKGDIEAFLNGELGCGEFRGTLGFDARCHDRGCSDCMREVLGVLREEYGEVE